MSNTDFIDDDLIRHRDVIKEVKIGPAKDLTPAANVHKSDTIPVRELNLPPLAKRKDEINSQVATKLDELERLRARQEALEHEKKALETLRSNQEKYETGRREMIDHVEQSLVTLEREEISLNQRLDLISDTEKRFKEMLVELRNINEEKWPADSNGFREELSRVLVVIDNIRKEYNKALAKIDALKESRAPSVQGAPLMFPDMAGAAGQQRSFWDWLKLGLAVSLPVTLMLVALIIILIVKLY